MGQPLSVPAGTEIDLDEFDAGDTGGDSKEAARAELEANLTEIDDLGYRLYAEAKHGLLVVLQGMDTSGKDGTIRKVMQGFNPQTCDVTAFKQPSAEELAHDFFWRITKATPRKGHVAIFNRSHYEDVLVVRVHELVPRSEWETRYERINAFEQLLHEGGTTIVKIFLHISKDEQRRRLQARLDDPDKRWKFSTADTAERRFWDDYQKAYRAALTKCNTRHAPWYIVPANHKWCRNLVVSRILRKALEKLDPQFPPAAAGIEKLVIE